MAGEEIKITSRILDDAKSRAKLLIENAGREADEIIAKANKNADEKYKSVIESSKKEAEALKQRMISSAELDCKKEMLQTKIDIINDVYIKVINKLSNLKEDEYVNLLQKMLVSISGDEEGELILPEKEAQGFGQKLVDMTNKSLIESGKLKKVTLSDKKRPIDKGFILVRGNIEINYSFKTILETRKEEFEPLIVSELF